MVLVGLVILGCRVECLGSGSSSESLSRWSLDELDCQMVVELARKRSGSVVSKVTPLSFVEERRLVALEGGLVFSR